MPNVKLPTGVDLYYESHGQGEPLVLIPYYGILGGWLEALPGAEAIESLNLIIHDPRGCGRSVVK